MSSDRGSSSMLAFITGGSGFVGSHIIDELIAQGHAVRALARSSSSAENVRSLGAEPVVGDLDNPESLTEACRGCDVVIHAAARVEMTGAAEEFKRTTVDGTRRLVEAAKSADVRRFVHISSCGVYHPDLYKSGVTITEDTVTPEPPDWFPYGQAKHRAERVVAETAGNSLDYVIIRLGYLFGPRNRAMNTYMLPAMTDTTIRIVGDGKNEIAVVYVCDIAKGVVLACGCPAASRKTLILGGFERVTQKEFFYVFADGFGIPRVKKRIPYWLAFLGCWIGEHVKHKKKIRETSIRRAAVILTGLPQRIDCAKTQALLGWKPTTTFEDGMRETFEWYRQEYK